MATKKRNSPPPPPFRALVEKCRRRNLPKDAPPRTYAAVAASCSVSRPYFYVLMRGERMPSAAVENSLAEGLGVSRATVHKALLDGVVASLS